MEGDIQNFEGSMFLFCLEKESCLSDTWCKREDEWKVTFRILKEECFCFVWRRNHACQIHGVRERMNGR